MQADANNHAKTSIKCNAVKAPTNNKSGLNNTKLQVWAVTSPISEP